jgi:hypothetical protein
MPLPFPPFMPLPLPLPLPPFMPLPLPPFIPLPLPLPPFMPSPFPLPPFIIIFIAPVGIPPRYISDTLSLLCRLFIMAPLGELLLLLLVVLDFIIIIIVGIDDCGALVDVCVATPGALVSALFFEALVLMPLALGPLLLIFGAFGAFVFVPFVFDVCRTS